MRASSAAAGSRFLTRATCLRAVSCDYASRKLRSDTKFACFEVGASSFIALASTGNLRLHVPPAQLEHTVTAIEALLVLVLYSISSLVVRAHAFILYASSYNIMDSVLTKSFERRDH